MTKIFYNSKSSPTLRVLYRKAKKIAKNAPIGSKIMCPCGCLQMFKKKNANHIFQKDEKNKHKNEYYNLTRSTANNALDGNSLKIRKIMTHYNRDHEHLIPVRTKSERKLIEIDKKPVSKDFSIPNLITLMKINKDISKNTKTGTVILCSCGCGETFNKKTYQQVHSSSDCKDRFFNIVRGDIKLTEDENTMKSFIQLSVQVDLGQKEKPKIKPKTKKRKL